MSRRVGAVNGDKNMNKIIDDHDRIIIGVREWAVHEATKVYYDVLENNHPSADEFLNTVAKLEEYVLGGIVSKEKTV